MKTRNVSSGPRFAVAALVLSNYVVGTGAIGAAEAAFFDVEATGTCGWRWDDKPDGKFTGLTGARVELWDRDETKDELCGTGTVGKNGEFKVRGRCGDEGASTSTGARPDLFVRCLLSSPFGSVKKPDGGKPIYSLETTPLQDAVGPITAVDLRFEHGPAVTFQYLTGC